MRKLVPHRLRWWWFLIRARRIRFRWPVYVEQPQSGIYVGRKAAKYAFGVDAGRGGFVPVTPEEAQIRFRGRLDSAMAALAEYKRHIAEQLEKIDEGTTPLSDIYRPGAPVPDKAPGRDIMQLFTQTQGEEE